MFFKKIIQGAAAALVLSTAAHAAEVSLLNVSYDPTRELYQDFNKAFAAHWKAKSGDDLKNKQFIVKIQNNKNLKFFIV